MVQFNVISLLAFAPAALAATIEVDVGSRGDVFNPNTVTAAVGDIVQFNFANTHNVAQSDYNSPCASSGDSAIFSGDHDSGSFSVMINSTDPIWLFCGYARHCQRGMVMAINPPTSGDETIEGYSRASAGTSSSTYPNDIQGGIVGDASAFSGSSDSGSGSTGSDSSSATESATASESTAAATSATAAASGSASASASPSSTAAASGASANAFSFGIAGLAGFIAAFAL